MGSDVAPRKDFIVAGASEPRQGTHRRLTVVGPGRSTPKGPSTRRGSADIRACSARCPYADLMTDEKPGGPTAARRASVAMLPGDLGLTWRPLSTADVDALYELIVTMEVADEQPYRTSHAEVEEIFEGDWKDIPADTVAGVDADGVLRAYACLEARPGDETTQRVFVMGGVHPLSRGAGVGRALVAWMTRRAKDILEASDKDVSGRIAAYLEDTSPSHWHLYEAAGYQANRFYSNLRRDLREPVRHPEPRRRPADRALERGASTTP